MSSKAFRPILVAALKYNYEPENIYMYNSYVKHNYN